MSSTLYDPDRRAGVCLKEMLNMARLQGHTKEASEHYMGCTKSKRRSRKCPKHFRPLSPMGVLQGFQPVRQREYCGALQNERAVVQLGLKKRNRIWLRRKK